MPRFRTRLALLAGLAAALGCSHDTTGSGTNDVARHRRKWESQRLADYAFEFRRTAQAQWEPAVVEVRAGAVFRATSLLTGQQLPASRAREYPTIEKEFDQVQAIANTGAVPEVSWDGTLGYPTHVVDRSTVPDTGFEDRITALHAIVPGS